MIPLGWGGQDVMENSDSDAGGWEPNAFDVTGMSWSGLSESANRVMKGAKGYNVRLQAISTNNNLGLNYTKDLAKIAKISKYVKRAGVAGTIVGGGVQIGVGYVQDGNSYGYNAQKATASVAGGAGGVAIGTAIGAGIGAWLGGIGAIPGAAIGGAIGSVVGSFGGSKAGEAIYDGFAK
jgi:hypothetical protein